MIKGITNPIWLLQYSEGQTILEKGYGSYTTDLGTAYKYAHDYRPVNTKYLVYMIQKIEPSDKALYITDSENEWLLPRNRTYYIYDVTFRETPQNYCAITYYVSKVNE